MAAFRGPKVWLWRWRRNPLRRRSDALEAWIMLTAWAFTVLGGAVTASRRPRPWSTASPWIARAGTPFPPG